MSLNCSEYLPTEPHRDKLPRSLESPGNDPGVFIALVGASGSGKTLLGRDLCFNYGGAVVDVELAQPNLSGLFNGLPQKHGSPGPVLVLDRPSKQAQVRSPSGLLSIHSGSRRRRQSLANEIAARRVRSYPMPLDGNGDSQLFGFAKANPSVAVVVTFSDWPNLETALRDAGSRDGKLGWTKAVAVDLDNCTVADVCAL